MFFTSFIFAMSYLILNDIKMIYGVGTGNVNDPFLERDIYNFLVMNDFFRDLGLI